ncbi:MAG: toll/interleukin-1 receptor domain-containing protein [Fimbriimonadaceae bacterium]
MAKSSTVFVSYSWDDDDHSLRVLQLAETLEQKGIAVIFDQFDPHPGVTWPQWMTHAVTESEFALCVCTSSYYERWHGRQKAGVGLGCQWEGTVITNVIASEPGILTKFIPIQLGTFDIKVIPEALRGNNRFCLSEFDTSEPQFGRLYAILTNQSLSPRPLRGDVEILSPRSRPHVARSGVHEATASSLSRTQSATGNAAPNYSKARDVSKRSDVPFIARLAIKTKILADDAYCREEYEQAASLYRKANDLHADPFHLSNAAQAYWLLDKKVDARSLLDLALGKYPEHTCGIAQHVEWSTEAPEERLAKLDEALMLHKNDQYLLRGRANAMHDLGKTEEAVALLEALWTKEHDPNDAGLLAAIALQKDEFAVALRWVRELVLHAPWAANAWAHYGAILMRDKRIGLAIAAFQEALSLAPHYAKVLWDIGECFALMNGADQALPYLRRAVLLEPKLGKLTSDNELDGIRSSPAFLEFTRECIG